MKRVDTISSLVSRLDAAEMSKNLFYLASDPLPCRQLNVTLPGHEKNTLYEADDFIRKKLESWGYSVETEAVKVQALRRDTSKPIHHQYSPPDPSDPWYEAYNLHAGKEGKAFPEEVIMVIAHKDSQSWLNCAPGALDNAVGTVGAMEIARLLGEYDSRRSIRFMFCNEEHFPWTSIQGARNIAQMDLSVIAVLNIDSIGGKSAEDAAAGRKVNVTRFTNPEGEKIADMMAELNERYKIGLIQGKYRLDGPANDDGSFIRAGIPAAVHVIGSSPYADPNYHTENDTPENVDFANVAMATRLCLATVVQLDMHGGAAAGGEPNIGEREK